MTRAPHIFLVVVILAAAACRGPSPQPRTAQVAAPSQPQHTMPALDKPPDPWWSSVEFVPTDSTIAGLAVSELDTSWEAVSPIRLSLLPAIAFADTADVPKASDFALGGDFNGDSLRDSAIVGVYRRHDHYSGGPFLLVLTHVGGVWRKAYMTYGGGKRAYTSVTPSHNGFRWWFCRGCSDDWAYTDFEWDGKEYQSIPKGE